MTKDRLSWLVLIALCIGFMMLVVELAWRDSGTLLDRDRGLPLVYNVALLALVGTGVVVHFRLRPGHILKHLATWLAIGAVLVLGYSYRHDVDAIADRLMAELVPSRGVVVDGEVTFRERSGGHFVIDADVDGVAIQFLVDTGATDVTLTRRDAKRLGFDTDRLKYDRVYSSANGPVKGAPIRLGRIEIGPISITNVHASVNAGEMDGSLLGMSYLSRLSSFEVAKGTLILRP